MAKFKERNEAQSLRTDGMSISEIAKKLAVSKSTVSGWCRDIVLSEKAIVQIAKRSKVKSTAALLRYSELVRRRRKLNTETSLNKGEKEVGVLSNRDIYCVGLGLYWGEGYKTGSQEFGFTNSDPHMVSFYVKWLEVVFGVQKSDLIFRISINALHRIRVREIERFWMRLLNVPGDQFTKVSLIKTQNKKVYKNDKHMGTLRIKVRRGTNLRREVLGAISGIVQQT